MTYHNHEGCGGTIATGGSGETAHWYCDRCGAFTYHDPSEHGFPTGTNKTANREAYDNEDDRSPEKEQD